MIMIVILLLPMCMHLQRAWISPHEIHQSVIDIAMDYLAAGIDPKRSTIFMQSEIPAIAEMTFFFSMLIPYPRLMRNPTIKDEIRDKGLGDNYSFGFLLYPVGQVADILVFQSANCACW